MRNAPFLPVVLLLTFLFSSCSSSGETVSATLLESAVLSSSAAEEEPFIYENVELGFSFAVPARWKSANYKIVVTHGDQTEDQSDYSQVSFYFQNDKGAPLLTLYCVKSDWWENASDQSVETLQLLGERSQDVFCFSLPSSCPYADEQKEELFTEMMISSEEVAACFQLMGEDSVSYVEGLVVEAAMHSLVITTEDDRQLAFSFDEESSAGLDGLLLGDTIRVGYRGTITDEDTRGVTVVSLQTISHSKSFGTNVLPSSSAAEPVPIEPSSGS